ncbi:MAG: serine/threonine protein kinase [Planctomycetia bacterium]|nr:serine/threonine protein kinase [Planctomycetia bacterium]
MTCPEDTAPDDETPDPGCESSINLASVDDILAGHAPPSSAGAESAARVNPEDLRLLLALRALAAERRAATAGQAVSLPHHIARYRVEAELGRGGFAVVYAATDTDSGQRVAVKLLLPEAHLSPAKRKRFEKEAKFCSRLDHPGIVPLLAIGRDREHHYLVSELCPGGSLAAWLDRHPGPLAPATSARIVARLAHAVGHAHAKRIIHRDIKPANVLLVPAGPGGALLADADADGGGWEVKLGDFGLGKLVHGEIPADDELLTDATKTGTLVGSPEWMAPEQVDLALGKIGPPTDVHGLGLLLDRLLSGRSRFAGEHPSDTFRRLRSPAAAAPPDDLPGVPQPLLTIRNHCLERRPEDRPPTAGMLAAALDALAGLL